ncbi:MFS transporter [Lactiplantibacillus argentoratensis]|uniref:MFS transporter n=1 Tax=Lactiplantibacillus argentoratensis TaxID=271881 RepID=UPI003EB7999E
MNKNKLVPWLVMVCIGLTSAACIGAVMGLFSFFITVISRKLAIPMSILSYYYTVIVLVMAVMMPIIPKILDKVSAKLIYTSISIIISIMMFLMAYFTKVWMFFIAAAVLGVCVSFVSFVPVGIILDNWFVSQKGLAIGICWGIGSVFNCLTSPIFSNLITKVGYQKSLFILAIVVAILSIPSSLLGIYFSPQKLGLKPFGYKKTSNFENKTIELEKSTQNIFRTKTFWILGILMVLIQFPAVFNQLVPTYSIQSGFGLSVGGVMISSAMLFDIVLNPLVGVTCDKFGAERASIAWFVLVIISYVLLLVSTAMKLTFLAIFAVGLNDIISVFLGTGITSLAVSLLGKSNFAKGFSLVSSISFIIGAFAMPVNSLIAERMNGFNSVFTFWIIILIALIILTYLGKYCCSKENK